MKQFKMITCSMFVSAFIGLQGVNANEENLVPATCSGGDLLINNEFCIQSTPNGDSDYMVASASSMFPHPDTTKFPNVEVVATLCSGEEMIKAFRYTYDEDSGENSSMFVLFDRFWINDSIAFMNHFPVGIVPGAGRTEEESVWAQTLSFDLFEIEDSESMEIWPMNRMKRTFEEYQSYKCYKPTDYSLYPLAQ